MKMIQVDSEPQQQIMSQLSHSCMWQTTVNISVYICSSPGGALLDVYLSLAINASLLVNYLCTEEILNEKILNYVSASKIEVTFCVSE